MQPHPFWVVTGESGVYSGRRWWIVCVAMDEAEALRIVARLNEQRDAYLARRNSLLDERIAWSRDWWQRYPGDAHLGHDAQAEWRRTEDQLNAELRVILDEMGMMDMRPDWVERHDPPDYQIEKTYDQPGALHSPT